MPDVVMIDSEMIDTDDGQDEIVRVLIDGRLTKVRIPEAAFTSRQRIYGTPDRESTRLAILREQTKRILGLPPEDHPNPQIARMGGLRKDVTIRQGTVADLPPIPAPKPTAGEVAAGIIEKAGTLAEVKATLAAWLRAQK